MLKRLQNSCLNIHTTQKFARGALLALGYIVWCALRYDPTTTGSTLWADVDDVVGDLYHV